ncbi:AAA family ATPase [Paludisphaera sp.]|uniref:AAA family ATPase n=1 Tax=Paludisphaera sp. TaxID=2017432 RepID=UPI00301E1D02
MHRIRRNAPQGSPGEAVASRLVALKALAAIVESGRAGPALLTGEAGAGKTWLRRRLAEALPLGWDVAAVDAAPAIDAADFLTLLAARLGVVPLSDRPAMLRLAIEKALEDDDIDGRRRLLIVEDAHHAAPEVWAEVEALCDRLGEPGGFTAALIVGRTELARRMASPSLRSLATRLSKHLHLPPLDMEEAARLIPGVPAGELEILHRDAAGNPRRLLALAVDRLPPPRAAVAATVTVTATAPAIVAEASPPIPMFPSRVAEPAPSAPPIVVPHPGAPKVEIPGGPRQSPPPLLPSRPPLRVEDNLIEVGWDGALEADDADDLGDDSMDEFDGPYSADGELVDDHYAALQAWAEWARNRDRLSRPIERRATAEITAEAGEDEADHDGPEGEDEVEVEVEADIDAGGDLDDESALNGDLRAEPPHEHAPYGPLFGKMRLSH